MLFKYSNFSDDRLCSYVSEDHLLRTNLHISHFRFPICLTKGHPNFPLIEISMIDSLDNRDSTVLVKQNQISFLLSLVYFLKNSKELSNDNYSSSYVNAMMLHF